jgi:Co/Zn/Cd efflux system component
MRTAPPNLHQNFEHHAEPESPRSISLISWIFSLFEPPRLTLKEELAKFYTVGYEKRVTWGNNRSIEVIKSLSAPPKSSHFLDIAPAGSAASQLEKIRKREEELEANQCCTGNMKVLALSFLLFSVITIAQTFAGIAAHSQALLVDCVSMGVDAGTYFLNMFVETQRRKSYHRYLEVLVAAVSLSVLIFFTLDLFMESLATVQHPDDGSDDDDVNAYIILAFSVWGILFDTISVFAFMRNRASSEDATEMNIWSAFMHVAADFLRSLTTFVASIIILTLDVDGKMVDAWASLVVAGIILLGAAGGVIACIRSAIYLLLVGLELIDDTEPLEGDDKACSNVRRSDDAFAKGDYPVAEETSSRVFQNQEFSRSKAAESQSSNLLTCFGFGSHMRLDAV